jgi:hypothetical protein
VQVDSSTSNISKRVLEKCVAGIVLEKKKRRSTVKVLEQTIKCAWTYVPCHRIAVFINFRSGVPVSTISKEWCFFAILLQFYEEVDNAVGS